MFKNPFSFTGRIRRLEYGLSYIIYIIVVAVGDICVDTFYKNQPSSGFILLFIYIPLFWFILAQGAKRCHDRNNGGVYQLIPFYVLWMFFADGDVGSNEYGSNPKGTGELTDIDEIGNYL